MVVHLDRQAVDRFRTRKTASLLALLAYHCGRTFPRDLLIEQLWPDDDPEAARHRLNIALSWLRKNALPAGALYTDRVSVRLDPDRVQTDTAALEAELQAATGEGANSMDALERALGLYCGELLPGFYEDWIEPERRRLAGCISSAACRLVEWYRRNGDLSRAIDYARCAVRLDPLAEDSRADLVSLYAAAGRRGAALREFSDLRRLLAEELDACPSGRTRSLLESLGLPGRPGTHLEAAGRSGSATLHLEPVGGAAPLDSPFYIPRPADQELKTAIDWGDGLVLLKGPGGVGKTSLLARGLQHARTGGAYVALSNLQACNAEQLASADSLLRALAVDLSDQLDLDPPDSHWSAHRGANANLSRYLRRLVLAGTAARLVWAIDEVDRLVGLDFGTEVLAMFRTWHNERALDPGGPWERLTLVLTYATEAHLLIDDLNLSPFNVGTRIDLGDFTRAEVEELNRRSGSPLRNEQEISGFLCLVGGCPYLVRRGLAEMVRHSLDFAAFHAATLQPCGPFAAHLQRVFTLVTSDAALRRAVHSLLQPQSPPIPTSSFYRLRTAGIITGATEGEARFRSGLYEAHSLKLFAVPEPAGVPVG